MSSRVLSRYKGSMWKAFVILWNRLHRRSLGVTADRRGEARKEGLKNLVGHATEICEGPVSMTPLVQVRLAECLDAVRPPDVDQVGGLDAVADGKGDAFENTPSGGVLTGERLVKLGELWAESLEERAHKDLGDPASATRIDSFSGKKRSFVEALHVG